MTPSRIALDAVRPAAIRLGEPHSRSTRRVHDFLEFLSALKRRNWSEHELRAIGLAVEKHIDTMYPNHSHSDERIAAHLKVKADLAEEQLRDYMAIDGESPSTIDAHCDLMEQEIVTNRVLIRHRRAKASSMRATRTIARQRLNIGGAA